MANSQEKLFGKWHDVAMLFLGFGLTTLLGTCITSSWQEHAAERQSKANLIEAQRTQATAIYEDVSRLMDKRLYRWRLLFWAVERGDSLVSIARERAAYREALEEWNTSLNRNQAMLCRYFGFNAGNKFLQVSNEFRTLQDGITAQLRAARVDSTSLRLLDSQADALNREIFGFNNDLVEKVRTGTVGVAIPSDSINTKCGPLNG